MGGAHESRKRYLRVVVVPVGCEEVVVDHVADDARVVAVGRAEEGAGLEGYGVSIREVVYLPMEK